MPGHVMIIEDDEALRGLLARALPRRGYRVSAHPTAASALEALEDDQAGVDTILTDIHLGGMSGIELCKRVNETRPGLPVLVMTAFGSLETAIEAIRGGAYDFLVKPVDLGVLCIAVDRAVETRRLREEVRLLRHRTQRAPHLGTMVGESKAMRELFDLVGRVAAAPSSVLITGESGTGKELVARSIHDHSDRGSRPFVAINCAAVPEALLESELFGHTRGAFTDARTSRQGLFAQATGGTLFLDEIGDMPASLQPKLLRALQDRRIRPVGSDQEVAVDVRVVAATHRDIDQLVEDGRFRADLLYRLDVIRLEVPALRDRGNDVLLLAQRFVEQQAARMNRELVGFTPEVAHRLLEYRWPGNVRELQNCIERSAVLCRHDRVTVGDLPAKVRQEASGPPPAHAEPAPGTLHLPLDEVERRHVMAVLAASGGSRGSAARTLGIDRKTLYRKLLQWGVEEADEGG